LLQKPVTLFVTRRRNTRVLSAPYYLAHLITTRA